MALVAAETAGVLVKGADRPTLPRTALDHLNWLRGAAALAVVVGHIRGFFFVDYEHLLRRSAGLAGFYLFGGLGHEAVIVFFVLSGFFIGTSVLAVSEARPWSWRRFLLNRFTRLYVVLLPALALTAAWDSAGMCLFGADQNVYGGRAIGPHAMPVDVRQTIRVPTLLGNVAFLQDFYVRPYGSNGPLWSLSYEFWFYLVFPLLVCASAATAPRRSRAAMAAAALAIMALGGRVFLLYFLIWCMGALVAALWPRLARLRVPRPGATAVFALGLFLVVLVGARVRVLGEVWRGDLALGAATSSFVAVLLVAGRAAETAGLAAETGLRVGYARLGEALAGCSYTIYLVHYPLLVFLHAWLIRSSRWVPDAPHLLAAFAIFVAVLALYAYPVSLVTEAHTERVRRLTGAALGWLSHGGSARLGTTLSAVRPDGAES